VGGLESLVARDDLPIATTARAVLVLKAKAGGLSRNLGVAAGKRLIEAVRKGALRLATPADQLMFFDLLESQGPTDYALTQIAGQLRARQPQVRQAAHSLARRFGAKSAPLADLLWPAAFAPRTAFEDAVEDISTLARIDAAPRQERWEKLLAHPDPLVRAEAVRWWRGFKGRPEMVEVLSRQAPELVKTDASIKEDLASVLRHLDADAPDLDLPGPEKDKAALTRQTLAALSALSPGEKKKRAVLGQQVFERSACTKCHTTATETTPLAPSLKGSAVQKLDYLVESVLYPSKVIKTGFEAQTVVLKDGKVLSGLVKEEGAFLRVLGLDQDVRVAKADVESRAVTRVSIMPEGQEAQLSRRELVDLIAYLATLR
jgi:putative heme-binding domain-containing protein